MKMGRTARCIDAPRRWADEEVDEREEKESPSMAPEGERRSPRDVGSGSSGEDSATFKVLLHSPGSPTCYSLFLPVVVKRFDVSHNVNQWVRFARQWKFGLYRSSIFSIDSTQSADEADLESPTCASDSYNIKNGKNGFEVSCILLK